MSFYRSLLAATAALALAMPAFAADEATQGNENSAPTQANESMGTAAADTNAAAPQEANQQKVDINKATVKELAKVKGINNAQAKAIVAYRKKNGDFKSLDDLKSVKGFKKLNEEQMKNIQDQLTAG